MSAASSLTMPTGDPGLAAVVGVARKMSVLVVGFVLIRVRVVVVADIRGVDPP